MKQQAKNTLSSTIPPNNESFENIVIGSLLLESTAIDRVASFLKPDAFYSDLNREIYAVLLQMYDNGTKIDIMTAYQQLRKSGNKNDNLISLLVDMTSNISGTQHIEDHAIILHQLMVARKLIFACNAIQSKAFDPSLDIADTVDDALREIETITAETVFGKQQVSIGDAANESVALYKKRKELSDYGVKNGIDTGLKTLNFNTNGGFANGKLIILAARPAMGKTAMMLHFAKKAALSGTPVMIFSLEMETQSLTNRILLSSGTFDAYRFSTGKLNHYEEEDFYVSVDRLQTLPVTIDDTANTTIQQIKIKARNAKRNGLCGIVFIDYLQLIDMRHSNKNYNREQEVSQTSRAAKIMAKELDIPVVLLSQLSRNVESRSDKRPLLSDLRESGAIEQDADIVLFIHRKEYYNDNIDKGIGELIIAKQRDGATGVVEFAYNSNMTRITDKNENPF